MILQNIGCESDGSSTRRRGYKVFQAVPPRLCASLDFSHKDPIVLYPASNAHPRVLIVVLGFDLGLSFSRQSLDVN